MAKVMTIRISDDQGEILEVVAQALGKSVAEVVRLAIARQLEEERRGEVVRKHIAKSMEKLERLASLNAAAA